SLSAAGSSAAFAQSEAPLPPSLAALKSRKAEAHAITVQERQARIERAQRLMKENNLDAICLMGGTSLVYFTGIRWWNSERLFFMILPQRGEPWFVTPAFEEDRAREQISAGPVGPQAQVVKWHEDESPYEKIAFGLKERGVKTGAVGMEETVKFVFTDGVGKAAPQAKITSATPVTAGCRAIKSPAEIALMRLAASVSLQAYEAGYKAIHDGMTQFEFARLVTQAHDRLGFQGGAGVQVGEYSALPHGSLKPQVIREGTILLMDGGCNVEGYDSDISRTFVIGKPTDKMKKVFDIVFKAQTAALKTARPGIPCEAVDAAARKVIEDAGYGPGYTYFTHRLGHGMGMDGHEWPYLVKGNKLALAPHMTFSDEPGVYIRGEFGVRLEDDLHILDNGAELFTPQSKSLEEPFASA
ncbi:MAG: Xaa-Pro peptidase family protein, partial [Bryobacteraceae bacterium]